MTWMWHNIRVNMHFPENLSHQHLHFSPSKIVVNIHYEKIFNYVVACKKETVFNKKIEFTISQYTKFKTHTVKRMLLLLLLYK